MAEKPLASRYLSKRRYRIEAHVGTLHKFTHAMQAVKVAERGFVQSVKCDVNEEYYYVVVIATAAVHEAIRLGGFTDSIARPL